MKIWLIGLVLISLILVSGISGCEKSTSNVVPEIQSPLLLYYANWPGHGEVNNAYFFEDGQIYWKNAGGPIPGSYYCNVYAENMSIDKLKKFNDWVSNISEKDSGLESSIGGGTFIVFENDNIKWIIPNPDFVFEFRQNYDLTSNLSKDYKNCNESNILYLENKYNFSSLPVGTVDINRTDIILTYSKNHQK